MPEEAAGLHDHATPGRGRKLASGEGARSLPTATPRSQTQPGGHKAVKRRDTGTASSVGLTLMFAEGWH
ncbi:hypothetical protein [Pectobacterium brasiliense]|uniref:hypothetical protein n=1 Tax=Pectobacterium brasiliense TaxID=180957 RepID=UPI000AA1C91F|nr:hypothetical protein [Pectobacterium brasiliense]